MMNKPRTAQFATKNSSGTASKTSALSKMPRPTKNKYSYFEKRWRIDEEGYAHLISDNDADCVKELAFLFEEISDGEVDETYYDGGGHKRHRTHPTYPISGVIYHDKVFSFSFPEWDKNDNKLILSRRIDGYQDPFAIFDLLKFTACFCFDVILDTHALSSEIVNAMRDERIASTPSDITPELHCIDEERDAAFVWNDEEDVGDDGVTELEPQGGEWTEEEILNVMQSLVPEGMTVTLSNTLPCGVLMSGEPNEDIIPVIAVKPVDEKGGHDYDAIAFLSFGLAAMLKRAMDKNA